MAYRVIHNPAAEAASDCRARLDHVGVGDEVVIEPDIRPAEVVWSLAPAPSLDEALAAFAPKSAEGRECVPPNLANDLDPCLYVREALHETFTR